MNPSCILEGDSDLRFRKWRDPAYHHRPISTGDISRRTWIRAPVSSRQELNYSVTGCEISYFCIKRKSISLREAEWVENWLENLKYLSRRGISFDSALHLFSPGSNNIIGGLPPPDIIRLGRLIGQVCHVSGENAVIVQIPSESCPIVIGSNSREHDWTVNEVTSGNNEHDLVGCYAGLDWIQWPLMLDVAHHYQPT